MAKKPDEICCNCLYAVMPVDEHPADHCMCHRTAPAPVASDGNAVHFYLTRWPAVDLNGWCGDFVKRTP